METRILPENFRELEPFVEWALPTMALRLEKRLSVPFEAAQSFYNAIFPRIEEIIAFLDKKGIDNLDDAETRLMHMLLSVVEISTSIEIYKQMTVPLGVPHARFPMWNEVSDEW